MATVRNPTRWSLFSGPLRRSLAPGAEVETDDETALQACASGVFEIVVPELSDEDEPSATPVRHATRRGSKDVEVTEAPVREKR